MPAAGGAPRPVADTCAPTPEDLRPTAFIDSDSETVRGLVEDARADAADEHELLARLFVAVRDGVRYDPFQLPTDPAGYRASAVLAARIRRRRMTKIPSVRARTLSGASPSGRLEWGERSGVARICGKNGSMR